MDSENSSSSGSEEARVTGYTCRKCKATIVGNLKEFQRHLLKKHRNETPFICGQGDCDLSYNSRDSLIRHIRDHHEAMFLPSSQQDTDVVAGVSGGFLPERDDTNIHQAEGVGIMECSADYESEMSSEEDTSSECEEENHFPGDIQTYLEHLAGVMTLNLRSHGNITGTSISTMQNEVKSLLNNFISMIKRKLETTLLEKGVADHLIPVILKDLTAVYDPFKNLRTKEKQMKYFSENFGFVEPQEIFLGYRFDQRLNPESNEYEQTQVSETFQYVSVIETLKSVVQNPVLKSLIDMERKSDDQILRSYLDGEDVKKNTLITKYQDVLRLNIYCDDVQGAPNALSSKTYRQNLTAFYFSIQNLPPEVNSRLNSIHLLAVAYRQDVNKYGFKPILEPFFKELRQLESDEGVSMTIDGDLYTLRATLCVYCGDDLAAHEILGLMSPSANAFCRRCLVSRTDFVDNGLVMGENRTKEVHAQGLRDTVANRRRIGIQQSCHLNGAKFFDETLNAVFDPSHDLNNGLLKMECKLVLNKLVVVRKVLTAEQLNSLISSFNYGTPDRKNIPSANFTEENLNLNSYNMKQTAAQMACLLRVLPFLLSQFLEPNDRHLSLLSLLQKIMAIVNTSEITEQHLTHLEDLIVKHHNLFRELFVQVPDVDTLEGNENIHMGDEEDLIGGEDDEGILLLDAEDVPHGTRETPRRRRKKRVRFVNKHHHLLHYSEMIRLFGPLVLYTCMRFEGKHAIIKRFAAICCNFTNLPKTMADLYQIIQSCGMWNLKEAPRDRISYKHGKKVAVENTEYSHELISSTDLKEEDLIIDTKCVEICGVEYRTGLFVLLENPSEADPPKFGCIKKIFVKSKIAYLATDVWLTEGYNEVYSSYCVKEGGLFARVSIVSPLALKHHRAIAPWSPTRSDEIYLSLRWIL